ncbi:Altered inheritance of mitochondria protein 32 [Podila verticillata]|nr:Altered inheritance of mitochondria protein 32 [Podila verticillata]KAF9368472.1 Altered inheritance of mitochondria protein 32 [Podila verticillata]
MIITAAIAIGLVKHLWDTKSSTLSSGTTSSTTSTTTTTTTIIGQVAESHMEEHKEQHKEVNKEEHQEEHKEKKEKKEKKDKPPASSDSESIPYVSVNDCHSCTNPCDDMDHPHYPSYLKIDNETPLLHSTKPYTRHVLISTGQDDWVAHIDEDKDSLAPYMGEAIDAGMQKLRDENPGKEFPRIVLTNSSRVCEHWGGEGFQVIVLPDQIVVNNVTKDQCHDFFEAFLRPEVGHVFTQQESKVNGQGHHKVNEEANGELSVEKDQSGTSSSSSSTHTTTTEKLEGSTTIKATKTVTTITTTTTNGIVSSSSTSTSPTSESPSTIVASSTQQKQHAIHYEQINDTSRRVTVGATTFVAHRWLPKAAIMICSHRKRDKRCGVTAAILGKEFKRILRSKNIYGDLEGDVEIWMISHIGGHKFAGNVIVHKSEGMAVWYGRVDPCHCQTIVDVTIEQDQVIQELYRGSMVNSFNPSKKKLAW